MTRCMNCTYGYIKIYKDSIIITEDMAKKAGHPELTGWDIGYDEEYEICGCCLGNYKDCKNCERESQ